MTKTIFSAALVLLAIVIGIYVWLQNQRADERMKLRPASEIYKAREAALLKSRSQAMEAITKIVRTPTPKSVPGAPPTPTPSASPSATPVSNPTPTPEPRAAPPQ
jgi:hypothetical protein